MNTYGRYSIVDNIMAESSSCKHLEEKNVDFTAVSKSSVRFHKKDYKEMVKLKGHS